MQPAAGPAGYEREGVHGLVSRVLRAHPHHSRQHDMSEFLREHAKAVCKAPGWHGGQVHFRPGTGRQEPQCRVRDTDRIRTKYAMVQKYLPQIVTAGDCRIILVDGEPVPFALQRNTLAD